MKLNPEQERAATFTGKKLSLIAVPGSGKTLTMMARIANLINNHDVAPETILGMTFTRNAAEEMRNRLFSLIGDKASRVYLSTIHAFCHRLLRSEGRVFNMISGKEQIIYLKNIIRRLSINDISVGTAIREISLAKNNLVMIEEFEKMYEGDQTMTSVSRVYSDYDAMKEGDMLLDFDDLLVHTWLLLRDDEDVRDKYRRIFQNVLIDEFQDVNPAEVEILKLLCSDPDSNMFCVGDDAQSIYGFTGASVGNILNFDVIFPGAVRMVMNLNYRSTPQILTAAQRLISHNQRRINKEINFTNPDGNKVMVLESSSEESEAQMIVNEIQDLIGRHDYLYSEIACLYRANFQSRLLEDAFLQHKIPYHIINGLSFYARYEVKILLDYLRVVFDPLSVSGDEALVNILNVPNRYIGRKFIQELESFATDKGIHLYEGLQTMIIKLPYLRKNIRDFIGFMAPLIEDSGNLRPAEVIRLIRLSMDMDRFICDEDIPSADDSKIANIDQLQMAAARFNDIGSFLQYADSFKDEPGCEGDKEGVNLMTIHKSKGLEFRAVFIPGMVTGIMPSKRGELEEERRVCFVAITRAMELLYLSFSHTYLGAIGRKIALYQ